MTIHLIPQYQKGGVYSPPFSVYQPLPSANTNAGATTSSGSESKDLTDKDLLQMLKDMDGLPSDMAIITKNLQNFYLNQNGLAGSLKSQTSSIEARYISILNQIKVAKFNKSEYDNAYQQVSKNGGINEYAIDDRGRFVCTNGSGDDFQFMTASELKASLEGPEEDRYSPLTNSELLYARANDVAMANKNNILSVVQSGIGMETVTDLIQKAVNSLGSEENSEEGYLGTKKGRLIKGFQDYQQAVQEAANLRSFDGTVNDLYKYKILNKSQADAAVQAFAYIYSMLPENAKALLKSKSDWTEEGAQKLVQTLVASKLDNKAQFDVNLVGGPSHSSTSGDGSGKLSSSQLVDITQGIGGVRGPMTIDRGDGIQMSVVGEKYNLVTGRDGKALSEDMSMDTMLSESGLLGMVKNTAAITFGDQEITVDKLKNITYNNTGVMRAELPKNADGSVNLSVLEAYEQVEAQLDSLGHDPTPDEVRDAFESAGLTSLLRADGTPDPSKFGVFIVTEGYTTDKLSGVASSDFIKELSRTEARAAVPIIQRSLTVGTGKTAQTPKIDRKNALNPADMFSTWYDHIFKAAVYIPIDNNVQLAARLDKQGLKYGEALSLEEKYQNFEKQAGLASTSADVLNNNS